MATFHLSAPESAELIEETFKFWFNDQEHIRSPFPEYVQNQLKVLATERFLRWVEGLHEGAQDEVNDEIVAEKFEEIIFETALELVKTEDERITINYPFMPRVGDEITGPDGQSLVQDRWFTKEGDETHMSIRCRVKDGDTIWETKFELPA